EHRGENTFAQIARRLGYRFVAERLTYARALRPGDSFPVELTLKNTGFASPHLPRVVEIGLLPATPRVAPAVHAVVLPDADPRWWGPGAGTIKLRGVLPVPAGFPRGTYRLGLRLADPAERLRDDDRYAIRLGNREIAFATPGGWNILAEDVSVEAGRVTTPGQ
ncbi:MAG: DUF4832 domain-containing protein, partial [Verrucomicrobia bacterium]|nr:DUF4832 domain-containing protein [Verrucomicrobiota bacterium]